MLWLLILHLVALAAAGFSHQRGPPLCGTPFAITPPNLALFDSAINGSLTSQASSDVFGSIAGPRPWPRNAENKVVIQYCFMDTNTRNRIGPLFQNVGLAHWMSALGGEASRASGHGVVFVEAMDQNRRPITCLLPNDDAWDNRLDDNTVVVSWDSDPDATAAASAGYVGWDANVVDPGIHQISIGARGIEAVAHEVGHILGMAHEHQRNDRDQHIEYRCHRVLGYQEAVRALREANPHANEALLCNSFLVALEYEFNGAQFVRGQSGGDPRNHAHGVAPLIPVADHGQPYDVDSLMHYPSYGFGNDGARCGPGDTSECVMVKRLPGGRGGFIPPVDHPSVGDVRWVKRTYPWMDPLAGRAGGDAGDGAEGEAGSSFAA